MAQATAHSVNNANILNQFYVPAKHDVHADLTGFDCDAHNKVHDPVAHTSAVQTVHALVPVLQDYSNVVVNALSLIHI